MLSFIQNILLSRKKSLENNQYQEIMKLVHSGKILHNVQLTKNGIIVRKFNVILPDGTLCAKRIKDFSGSNENQIRYSIKYTGNNQKLIKRINNNNTDAIAQHVFTRTLKLWEQRSKQHAK